MAWAAPQAEIEAGLREDPAIKAAVYEVAGAIEGTAKGLARVRAYATGDYFNSIMVVEAPGGGFFVVATSRHAWFVEVGTGIYGPKRAVIQASQTTAAGVFQFEVMDRGAPRTVVTSQQVGRPARHVMRDAAESVAALPGLRYTPSGID